MQVAGMDFLGELHGPVHVLGEDAGGEAKAGVVGLGDGVVDVVKGADCHGGAEQLFPRNQHLWTSVGHYGCGVHGALASAAGDDPRALAHGLGDPALDPLGVGLANHRPHLDVLVKRVADAELLGRLDQRVQQVGVNRSRRKHPLRRDAHLPGVGEPAGHGCRGDLLNVGIGHDDERAVGTQLHGDLLDAGVAANLVADFHAAGEGDLAHVGRAGDGVANLRAGAGDGLDGFFRQAGFQQDLGEFQGRQRSVAGRLEDDGVAGGQGRPHLVAHQVQREVERRDGGHDAHGHADGEPELADHAGSGVQRHGLAVQSLGFLGGQRDGLDGALHFATALSNDFAFLAGDGLGQVVGPFVHQVGGALQDAVTAVRRQLGHDSGAPGRAGDGSLNVGGGAPRHGVKGVLVKGIDDGHLGIAVHPLAADIHLHG